MPAAKLSDALVQEIAKHLRAGVYLSTAAELVGINRRTLTRWRARGRAENARVESGERLRKKETLYADFARVTDQATAQVEARNVNQWQESAKDDWKANRDFLERRFPKKYGTKINVTLQNEFDLFFKRLERHLDAELFERVLVIAALPDDEEEDEDESAG